MESRIPIEELSSKVLAELKRLNYSYNYICIYKAFYKQVISYFSERKERYFSEALGFNFLKEQCGCESNIYTETMPKHQKLCIRKIRVLGDYQLHGVIFRRIKKADYVPPPQFKEVFSEYKIECQKREYSKTALPSRIRRLIFFIDFIASKEIKNVNQITPELLSNFVKTIYPYHEKSISAILTTVRVFLKFLYLREYTQKDLSLDLPIQKKYYYPAIPSVWKTEDVIKMLKSVDRGNPAGKRNYAILLLVAKLGIRACDIKCLKLKDLNWNTKTIEINQSKTKHHVTYPILDDIGWALIDYIKNGRPNIDSPFVFIRQIAPYEEFRESSCLYNIIVKYTRLAGIILPKGYKKGMHSLRHTLASKLLEQGTSLPVISSILGHFNSKSTNVYLHTNLEGLKQCALNSEEVYNYGK